VQDTGIQKIRVSPGERTGFRPERHEFRGMEAGFLFLGGIMSNDAYYEPISSIEILPVEHYEEKGFDAAFLRELVVMARKTAVQRDCHLLNAISVIDGIAEYIGINYKKDPGFLLYASYAGKYHYCPVKSRISSIG
jgi:hypothetical protein